MHYFKTLSLEGFDPGAPAPVTAAKLEMIDHAKSDVSAFVQDLQANTEEMLKLLRTTWGLTAEPELVLNKHLLALYDPDGKTRVTSRGIGRALAAGSIKSVTVNRTAAFGTQRFYILRNAEKWLSAKPDALRDYIDAVFKVTPTKERKF